MSEELTAAQMWWRAVSNYAYQKGIDPLKVISPEEAQALQNLPEDRGDLPENLWLAKYRLLKAIWPETDPEDVE